MKYILLVFILLTTVGSAYAWDNNDRDYRKEITVSHINVSGSDLINYPAFLNVTKADGMQSDYEDLIFYDTSGNLMAAELEKGYTDYALIWINITTLSTLGTSFWVYYGNTTCSDSWDIEGVWNSDYAMVQHLNESPANGIAGHIDSTSNDNDAAPYAFSDPPVPLSTTNGIGKIDGADVFDGTNDYIDCGNGASLDITDAITISAWIYFPSEYKSGSPWMIVYDKSWGEVPRTSHSFVFRLDGTLKLYRTSGTLTSSRTSWPAGWYHIVAVSDSTTGQLYINGLPDSNIAAGSDTGNNLNSRVGLTINGGIGFNGTIDEVRISNVTRTSDWIKQDYEIVINQTSVVMFGDEEVSNKFIQEASYFHIEMVGGLTNFRDSMGKYLVWGILFFAIGLAFTLFAKIKYTLIGSK